MELLVPVYDSFSNLLLTMHQRCGRGHWQLTPSNTADGLAFCQSVGTCWLFGYHQYQYRVVGKGKMGSARFITLLNEPSSDPYDAQSASKESGAGKILGHRGCRPMEILIRTCRVTPANPMPKLTTRRKSSQDVVFPP